MVTKTPYGKHIGFMTPKQEQMLEAQERLQAWAQSVNNESRPRVTPVGNGRVLPSLGRRG